MINPVTVILLTVTETIFAGGLVDDAQSSTAAAVTIGGVQNLRLKLTGICTVSKDWIGPVGTTPPCIIGDPREHILLYKLVIGNIFVNGWDFL